jgi:hypothetical protein
VGRIRNARWCVAAATVGGCLIALAGCGGGEDDTTSTSADATTVAIPTVTQPAQPGPDGGSTSTNENAPGSNPADGARAGNGPPETRPAQRLSAFRDCLSRQGVSLQNLRGGGGLQAQRRNPEEFRAQAEKAFTCIPELPPQLRESAEALKRRFEERQRNSGNSNG